MRNRAEKASTLALVAVCLIVIVFVGIGFFYLLRILGGEREMAHAVDAGVLAVAKEALRGPVIDAHAGDEANNFRGLGDSPDLTAASRFNLLTFNRCVAQALLVAINAGNEGTADAATNARKIFDALEGPNSLGQRLRDELQKTTGNTLFGNFLGVGSANSLRMLGGNNVLQNIAGDFRTSYMEQKNTDFQRTNIRIDPNLQSMVPPELIAQKTADGTVFLRGYTHTPVGSVGVPIVGVPVQPGEQPHLVSWKDFNAQQQLPFADVYIPPNAFQSRGTSLEARSALDASGMACAKVGIVDTRLGYGQFGLEMPLGYIEVRNGQGDHAGGVREDGTYPGLVHVLADEMVDAPGILVAGNLANTAGVFGTGDTRDLMNAWAAYNAGTGPKPASTDGLYNFNGDPATEADAKNVQATPAATFYDPMTGTIPMGTGTATATVTQCQDYNVTGDINGDGSIPVCKQLWDARAFDRAYHPEAMPDPYHVAGPAQDLMAVECAKCRLVHRFPICGGINTTGCGPTGLRLYTRDPASGYPCPSDPGAGCVISRPGSVKELFQQTNASAYADVLSDKKNGIASRIRMIKPEATDQEIDDLLSKQPLLLGKQYFIYMNDPLGKDANPAERRKLTYSVYDPVTKLGAAPGRIVGDENANSPDGRKIARQYLRPPGPNGYGLNRTAVNPPHECGIHDIMFRSGPGWNTLQGRDSATWTPSSGFNNLLGVIDFSNEASGSAEGFCAPD